MHVLQPIPQSNNQSLIPTSQPPTEQDNTVIQTISNLQASNNSQLQTPQVI